MMKQLLKLPLMKMDISKRGILRSVLGMSIFSMVVKNQIVSPVEVQSGIPYIRRTL